MLLLVASGRWNTPAASHSLGSRTLMPRLHLLIHTGFPDNTSGEAHYLSLQTKKRIMAILLVQQRLRGSLLFIFPFRDLEKVFLISLA